MCNREEYTEYDTETAYHYVGYSEKIILASHDCAGGKKQTLSAAIRRDIKDYATVNVSNPARKEVATHSLQF